MAATGDDEVLTMEDVIKRQQRLEQDMAMVEQLAETKECSYSRGYVKQALFACRNCTPSGAEPAGICLACSLKCHLDHDVYELYEKRHFRCDCGNSKFKNSICHLNNDKEYTNEENKYSHNFFGKYCWCDSEYDTQNDVMLKCIHCEDWFHDHHLQPRIPLDSFQELLCKQCIVKLPFLLYYPHVTQQTLGASSAMSSSELGAGQLESSQAVSSATTATMATSSSVAEGSQCRLVAAKSLDSDGSEIAGIGSQDVFWATGWRTSLCRCESCLDMYKAHQATHLIEEDETNEEEEESDNEHEDSQTMAQDPVADSAGIPTIAAITAAAASSVQPTSLHDMGLQALRSLPIVAQQNYAAEFRDLSSNLNRYLLELQQNGVSVVTKEHIAEFMSDLSAKRRKLQ